MDNNVSFRVHKDELADAAAWVARSLPTKSTQPVLRAVVITADDNGLEFAGFDYEVSTRVRIGAEVRGDTLQLLSTLTDEQLALLQYAADNQAAWAAYFERRQQQRLASTNGASVVGDTKNSEGRTCGGASPAARSRAC